MIQSKTIQKALPHVLTGIDIPGLGKKQSGKVRDYYVLPDKRVISTTDRQSAFDVILGCIPYKGAVLNQLAAFWFGKTKYIIPNHMIATPDPNVLVAQNCAGINIEMIVRGYMTGVTKTSIWYSYQKGERVIYGQKFPDGLQKNQKLPHPVITPTTHGGGRNGHDERLTKEEILKRKLVSPKIYKQMEDAALALFNYGSKLCKKRGLILVDTKYEFGIHNGKLMLMDEIHTPDSSRFWIAKTYKSRLAKGQEPENFDKEFLRLWYAKKGYRGDGKPPKMSTELIIKLAQRYIAVYEKITGKKFKAFAYPIEMRIKENVEDYVKTTVPSSKKTLTYKQSGVDYEAMDFLKRLAQKAALQTDKNINTTNVLIDKKSRGESAFVIKQGTMRYAFVQEGLGTKNLIADAIYQSTGKTYYDTIAQDCVAAIVNDLITVGARPVSVFAYWAAGSDNWFLDKKRMQDLVKGWQKACDLSLAVWGGGETPTLKGIVDPATIDLGGSAFGITSSPVLGDKLQAEDVIILFESSGIHTNGLSLARSLADKLPKGYQTKLTNGRTYGESLLDPTMIYVRLVQTLLQKKIDIHYMVHITGHGWRKLMRHTKELTYRITNIPPVPPVLQFIQQQAQLSHEEAYGNLNMGAGFAIFVPSSEIKNVLSIAKKHHIKAYQAGVVEKGPKQVIIEPLGITFSKETLQVR